MSSETYIGMAIGKLKGPQAFFMRKLRFEGETKLLMKMHSLFPSVQKAISVQAAVLEEVIVTSQKRSENLSIKSDNLSL